MTNDIRSIVGRPYLVAVYLGACLILFAAAGTAVLVNVISLCEPGERESQLNLYLYMVCAGGVGAVVYCIRGLYRHCSDGDYDPKYVYWYIFRPWVGAVLGLISYFLIAGGLLAFSEAKPSDDLQAKALFVAVAFLAGFSANEFILKINALAESLFGRDPSKSKSEKKEEESSREEQEEDGTRL